MLERSNDPFVALLSYRATPLPWCNLSPAELSIGRKIRTSVPQTNKHLMPEWTYLTDFRKKNAEFKKKQKENFDNRHRVHSLPEIPDDAEAWVNSGPVPVRGRIVTSSDSPRSYLVSTPTGEVRRNRIHLNIMPPVEETPLTSPDEQPSSPGRVSEQPGRIMTRTRTGTAIHPPDRLA